MANMWIENVYIFSSSFAVSLEFVCALSIESIFVARSENANCGFALSASLSFSLYHPVFLTVAILVVQSRISLLFVCISSDVYAIFCTK